MECHRFVKIVFVVVGGAWESEKDGVVGFSDVLVEKDMSAEQCVVGFGVSRDRCFDEPTMVREMKFAVSSEFDKW